MQHRTTIRAFVLAYWNNVFAMMSGGPSVPLAIWAMFETGPTLKTVLWLTAGACIILSSFFVWRDEHRRANDLQEKADLVQATREQTEAIRAQTAALSQPAAIPQPVRKPLFDILQIAESECGWKLSNWTSEDQSDFSQGLRQAGLDGTIVFTGREMGVNYSSSTTHMYPLVPIASGYFIEHWIWLRVALERKNNAYIQTMHPGRDESRHYRDLHVEDGEAAITWVREQAEKYRSYAQRGRGHEDAGKTSTISEPDWPLPQALGWFWTRFRILLKYKEMVEYYEKTPERLMRMVAQLVFNHAEPPIPLYGVFPPLSEMQQIPQDRIEGWEFSDDARELFDKYWGGGRHINLNVRRSDIENRIKAMAE